MVDDGIVLTWGTVFSLLGFLGTVGANIGIIAVWGGGINARLKAVESHADKIEQIGPIQAQLTALKDTVGVEFKTIRDDIRQLAQSVRDLAYSGSNARRG